MAIVYSSRLFMMMRLDLTVIESGFPSLQDSFFLACFIFDHNIDWVDFYLERQV